MKDKLHCRNRGPLATKLALIAILNLWLVPSNPAWARDITELVTTPFKDPLSTRPSVLDKGVALPGDNAPVSCDIWTDRAKDLRTPLALIDAVDLSLCNNPQLKEAWTDIKVQAAQLGQAKSAYLPTLSLTESRQRTGTVYPDSGIASSSVIGNTANGSFNWRLFDFGTRAANRESAKRLLLAALSEHEAQLQKTLASTIQAYFDVQTAQAVWQAKEQDVSIATNTLESAKRREARGVAAHGDVLQATTSMAKAVLERNRASGEYRKNMATLIYAMGLPTGSDIKVAEENASESTDGNVKSSGGNMQAAGIEDLDRWLQEVKMMHPAIAAAKAKWLAAQSTVKSTRADGLPTIDFSATHYQNGYPGQGVQSTSSHVNTIGISLTVPLFDGFSRTYKIREAEAQVEKRKQELDDVEHSVLTDVVKAQADAATSLANLDASYTLLDAAQEALATSQRKYDRGAADISEILNTQTALADARQERVRCLAEWRSARLRLMANSGRLGLSSVH